MIYLVPVFVDLKFKESNLSTLLTTIFHQLRTHGCSSVNEVKKLTDVLFVSMKEESWQMGGLMNLEHISKDINFESLARLTNFWRNLNAWLEWCQITL